MESNAISPAHAATGGSHVEQGNSNPGNIQPARGGVTISAEADERAVVLGPGQVPPAWARHSRHINLVSALRPDPKDILAAEKLGRLDGRNKNMQATLARMAARPHLADVVNLLIGYVDTAEEHDYSLHHKPGWKPLATLWAGRTIFTVLQLARPVTEMVRDGMSRKSVAMFLPHQALSLVFAIGLTMRGTTHWRVVKDHLAKRDTFLTFQAAFKIFGLFPGAKPVVDHPAYSGVVTALSVLAAIAAIFPDDPRLGFNRLIKGSWEPSLSKALPHLTDQDWQDIRELRTESRAALADVREARAEFPDKPTESTDLVLSSFEGAYGHVEIGCSVLLGEEPTPPPNVDKGRKTADTIITGLVTISPIPFLKGNMAAIMGVAANHALGDYVQTKTTLDPYKGKPQTWDNFTKFCAVTLFMGPLFLINDTLLNDPAKGNFMEQSTANALIFAVIFTSIAYLTPGLVVNGLATGAGAGWTYVGKPYVAEPSAKAWRRWGQPVANRTVVPAWQKWARPAWNHTGGAAVNAMRGRRAAALSGAAPSGHALATMNPPPVGAGTTSTTGQAQMNDRGDGGDAAA